MRLVLVACVAAAAFLGGCATSLSSTGALQPVTLADGTTPLRVVAEAPALRLVPAADPALRLVSDDPAMDLGAPPVPAAPGSYPEALMPAAPAYPEAAWRAEDDAPAPPPAEAPPEAVVEEEILEEVPLREIQPEPPAAAAPAPVLRRGGACGCGKPACGGCDDPCCEKGYCGIMASILPGLGGGVQFGLHVHRSRWATWSVEVGLQHQDMFEEFDEETASGSLAVGRLGVRARIDGCGGCGHVVGRAGIAWVKAEGWPAQLNNAKLDWRGDYMGVYVGLGYEWQLGRNWSTGPEAMFFAGYAFSTLRDRLPGPQVRPSGRDDFGYFGMVIWHLDYRF